MSSQRILPYNGMYPNKQDRANALYNQDDQDSIDSFDLDFFATERSPTSIIENSNTVSFKNKISPFVGESNMVDDVNSLERKHVCQLCSKRFRTKWHLTEHMIVHTGIYPFQCESCKKGFKRRKALENHPCLYDDFVEQEEEETEPEINDDLIYTCPHCQVDFNTRTGYLKHTCNLQENLEYIFASKKEDFEGQDSKKKIIFQEPHGEAVEVDSDMQDKKIDPNDFDRDTLRIEDGIDAIADLTGLSITEVNETLEYFCKKFDANEKDHKVAVETLKTGELPIKHKTQDESEHAIEMFNL